MEVTTDTILIRSRLIDYILLEIGVILRNTMPIWLLAIPVLAGLAGSVRSYAIIAFIIIAGMAHCIVELLSKGIHPWQVEMNNNLVRVRWRWKILDTVLDDDVVAHLIERRNDEVSSIVLHLKSYRDYRIVISRQTFSRDSLAAVFHHLRDRIEFIYHDKSGRRRRKA